MINLWQPVVSTIFIWFVALAEARIRNDKKFSAVLGATATLAIWLIYFICS